MEQLRYPALCPIPLQKKLMAMALDRGENLPTSQIPNNDEPALLAFAKLREKAAAELANTPNETVEIAAWDGIRLVGHWLSVPNAKRVLVAMHGWRSSWSRDFGMLANFSRKTAAAYFLQSNADKGAAMATTWASAWPNASTASIGSTGSTGSTKKPAGTCQSIFAACRWAHPLY